MLEFRLTGLKTLSSTNEVRQGTKRRIATSSTLSDDLILKNNWEGSDFKPILF